MRGAARGTILGAVMLLPALAWAGTPAEEADRCSRYLTALAHGDDDAAVTVLTERYKPGELPERYIRAQRNDDAKVKQRLDELGGLKAIEALPDVTVSATGDILRRQKWIHNKGDSPTFVGCVMWSGDDIPWRTEIVMSGDDSDLVRGMTEMVMSGKAADTWRKF